MKGLLTGLSVCDEVIAATMKKTYETTGEMICPHTAAGVHAADRFLEEERAENTLVVTLATAHPAKFVEVCRDAVGVEPEIPERLARVLGLPKQSIVTENTLEALSRVLLDRLG